MRSLFLFQMAKTPLALFPLLAAAIPSVNASAQVPNPIRTPHPGIAPPSVALLPTLAGKAAPLFAVPDGKWNHGEGCGELVVATMSGDVYVLDVDSMQIRMRTHVDGALGFYSSLLSADLDSDGVAELYIGGSKGLWRFTQPGE
jgi:hypothetical protein